MDAYELIEKLEINNEKYTELIRKNQEFADECYQHFMKNKNVISDKEYVDVYEKRLKELNEERQELNSEWEKLKLEMKKWQ